jgi:hypothetical protein
MPNIAQRTLSVTRPKSVAFFIRDSKVKGFAIKVNPSGSMKYIAEVYHDGRTVHKTQGEKTTDSHIQIKNLFSKSILNG